MLCGISMKLDVWLKLNILKQINFGPFYSGNSYGIFLTTFEQIVRQLEIIIY